MISYRVTFTETNGPPRECYAPQEGATDVAPVVSLRCPSCWGPLRLRGKTPTTLSHSVESVAVCVACETPVGKLEVELPTLFGTDEDSRVLNGPWKVF